MRHVSPESPAQARVAFYMRISTDEVHQKFSLGAQEDRLRAYCTAQYGNEWTLHRLYQDTESGSHTERPGLQQMLADAASRHFDTMLVFRIDRLSRNIGQLASMVDTLGNRGVTVRSATEPFDTSNLSGRMMLQMLGVIAEFERGTIIERTKAGMSKKAGTGKFVGGSVPYGYRLEKKGGPILPEPEEAAIVRRIFTAYVEKQEGVFTLCRKLNEAGLRKRSGQTWDRRILLHMLRNPIYIGKIRWGGKVLDADHEPILPVDLFEAAAAILDSRSNDMKARVRHTREERFLTGVIHCHQCGSRMVGVSGRKNGERFAYYACTGRLAAPRNCSQAYIRAEHLEREIFDDAKSILADDELLERACAEIARIRDEQRPQLEAELRSVEGQRAQGIGRRDRYWKAFESGDLSPKTCEGKVVEINEQMAQLDAERERLQAAMDRLGLISISRDELRLLVGELDTVLAAGDRVKQKNLLHRVVKEVRVHDRSTVEVTYALSNPDAVRTPLRLAPLERQRTNRMRELEPLVALRVVLRLRPRRGTFCRHRVELEFSDSALPSPHERVATKDRHLRHQRHLVLWEALPARPHRHAERHRSMIDRLRRAMVWRTLLEAGVLRNRAALARWQGVSRAHVTQELRRVAVAISYGRASETQ